VLSRALCTAQAALTFGATAACQSFSVSLRKARS